MYIQREKERLYLDLLSTCSWRVGSQPHAQFPSLNDVSNGIKTRGCRCEHRLPPKCCRNSYTLLCSFLGIGEIPGISWEAMLSLWGDNIEWSHSFCNVFPSRAVSLPQSSQDSQMCAWKPKNIKRQNLLILQFNSTDGDFLIVLSSYIQ